MGAWYGAYWTGPTNKKKHKTNGLNERREGEVCRPRKRRKNGGD